MEKNEPLFLLLIAVILLICILPACQPTPENQIITQKDDLEYLIQNTAAPEDSSGTQTIDTIELAESDEPQPTETEEPVPNYKETLEFEDSAFKVIINAVIDQPDEPLPVAKVEPYKITQEDVDRALQVFMPNKQLYEIVDEDFMARDTIQKQIFKLEALIAKIKGDEKLDEQIRRSLIGIHVARLGMLENMLKDTTIDLLTWVEATSKLKELDNNVISMCVKTDMGKSLFAFFNTRIIEEYGSAMCFTNDDFYGNVIGLKRINGDIPGMKTTFKEAKGLAEDTLKRLGIVEDISLNYAELGVYRAVPDEDWIATEYIQKRYMFYFASEINGIQAQNIQICRGFEQDNNVDYDYRWGDEYIFVAVDDTGIVEFMHFEPGVITKIINDNVEIIDFEEALEIFKKQIFYEGVWTGQGISFSELNITKIQLNMFRLRLKDKNEYMYIPVWDFIGTWKTINYGTEEGQEYSFLTINAIDGSIINRDLGY